MNQKKNKYEICGDIVKIYLGNGNEYTTINTDKWNDIEYIQTLYWRKVKTGYVEAVVPLCLKETFNKERVKLHQIICPCDNGFEPDHNDKNPLNNTTENLIPKTHMQNMQNQSKRSDNTSGSVGVSFHKYTGKWAAYITVNQKRIYLGEYTHKEDAIKARKEAEEKYFNI